jgi:hypothetical protein
MTVLARILKDKKERVKIWILAAIMAIIAVVVLVITFIINSSSGNVIDNGGG